MSKTNLHSKRKRKPPDYQMPKYFAEVVGLGNSSIGGIIDGSIRMIQASPSYTVAFCPLPKHSHPNFTIALFYGNCIAYLLDCPVIVLPQKTEFYKNRFDFLPITRPLPSLQPALNYVYDSFNRELCVALESIWSIRSGPLVCVEFASKEYNYDTDFQFTKLYSSVAKEIQLYSTSLRQLDPLNEYLNYYRILESTVQNNAKEWIEKSLNRIFNFPIVAVNVIDGLTRRKTDLYKLYRRKAKVRLSLLMKKYGNEKSIAEYLYNENRCGIAHGKSKIRKSDFSEDYFSIVKDNSLLKLLARLAIEDKRQTFI